MEFKQIEAFVNVVKHKSFSKAADATFLTQPTISAHISALEKELGCALIERRGRESVPTKAGKELYRYAVDMVNTREAAISAIGRGGEKAGAVLEIQASGIPGQFIVPKLIAGFARNHPNVRFYMEISDSREAAENIINHKGEIGFTGENRRNNRLEYTLIGKEKALLITPDLPEYEGIAGNDGKVILERLSDERFIWREDGSATRELFEEKYRKETGKSLKAVATLNDVEAIKQCVAAGLGISVVSAAALDEGDSASGRLKTFEVSDEFTREFYMIYRKSGVLSPAAEEFIKYVEANV